MEWIRGEEIGHGGFASISLAVPKKKLSGLPPLMAVKSCDACDTCDCATLVNECEVLSRLGECPYVIKCLGSDRTVEGGSEKCNLLLEYAAGGSLVNEMKRWGGSLPEPEVRRHTRSVLEAMRHIHSKGFVHGDIKVQNILVFPAVSGCGAAEVKVADFGLSRESGSGKVKPEDGRGGFQWVGTPLYMSPEAVNDNEYEAPSDVWALGCAVVEMATGKPAWDHPAGSNIYRLLIRIGLGDEIPAIPQDLSDQGKDFLRKCFVKDPAKRWTTEMLLNHPFVAGDNSCQFALPSPSPRSHFDFVDWDSSAQSSPVSISHTTQEETSPFEFWEEESESISLDDESDVRESLIVKLNSLACEEMPNWEDSDNGWITVRGGQSTTVERTRTGENRA